MTGPDDHAAAQRRREQAATRVGAWVLDLVLTLLMVVADAGYWARGERLVLL